MFCSPAPSCPRCSHSAAASWLSAGEFTRRLQDLWDGSTGLYFHHGESRVVQALVALVSMELVELASLDPLQ